MATNPKPIIFKITEAGKQAALTANADSAQLKINLTQVAVGTGKYTPTGSETSLKSEIMKGPIVSGDIERSSNTLRFSSDIRSPTVRSIYEIGLLTDTGILFAVAASSSDALFTVHPDITFVASFGLSLKEIASENITVTTDPNGAISIVLMENHLAAPDPHPQYLNKSRFQMAMQALYPMGYQHHTHIPVNPKPIFDDILGLDTAWRRITGKIFISSDPSDPFINDYGIVLGQRGVTELAANGVRPNVYPLQTTHTFERYDPNDNIETVWKVVANKTAINEGSTVRFTVTANNLPDGQILNWAVKEGTLNSTSNDITTPEKSDSGTVILKNGQAVVDFTTTPDDHEEEAQKHVRLTVGAPANLSINVPITDAGYNETAIHITQSTNEGIDLAEYYKQQSGSYPTASDNVRFIVDSGVDIVAPDTNTPAIVNGSNWPSGNVAIVENRGRILGHGGKGGNGAAMMRNDSYTRTDGIPDTHVPKKFNATAGTNGGTAVKGNLLVENYNVVAGGGGGGGGSGSYLAGFIANWTAESSSDIYHTSVDSLGRDVDAYAGSGVGGGGAPFGDTGMVTLGLDWVKKTYPDIAVNVEALISEVDSIAIREGHEIDQLFLGSGVDGGRGDRRASPVNPYNTAEQNGNLDVISADIEAIRNKFSIHTNRSPLVAMPITARNPEFYNPKYETSRYRYYSSQSTPNYAMSGVQTLTGAPMSAMEQPSKATLTDKGLGGANSPEAMNTQYSIGFIGAGLFRGWREAEGGWLQQKNWTDYLRGGNGGNYGENGEDGRLDKILYNPNLSNTSSSQAWSAIALPINFETHIEILPPASGGLAGYIAEGNVTITNFGSGTTKGR